MTQQMHETDPDAPEFQDVQTALPPIDMGEDLPALREKLFYQSRKTASLQAATATIVNEIIATQSAADGQYQANLQQIEALELSVGDAEANITALDQEITNLTITVNENTGAISAVATRTTALETTVGENSAAITSNQQAITDEVSARASADSAITANFQASDAQLQNDIDTLARLTEVADLYSSGDDSLVYANQDETIMYRMQTSEEELRNIVFSSYATITYTDTVVADASSALASSIQTLEAEVQVLEDDLTTNYATIVALQQVESDAAGARATLETNITAAYQAADTALSNNVAANYATIAYVETVEATADEALASVTLQLDVNGYAVGYTILNDGTTGNVDWLADAFTIRKPSAPAEILFEFDAVTERLKIPNLEVTGDSVFGDETLNDFVKISGGQLVFGSNTTIGNNTDRTVTVGDGGDYADIDVALVALSKVVPAYKSGGFTATISCLPGYTDRGGHWINGVDLSWIEIDAVGGTLQIDNVDVNPYWMRVSRKGVAPKIVCNVNVTSNFFEDFYWLEGFSHAEGDPDLTFTTTTAGSPSFSFRRFVNADDGSSCFFPNGEWNSFSQLFSGGIACTGDFFSPTVNNASIVASIDFGAKFEGVAGTYNNISYALVQATGGCKAVINSSSLTGSKPSYGVFARAAEVNADSCDLSGCGTNGILCDRGGHVTFRLGNARKGGSDSSSDMVVNGGGTIAAQVATGGTNIAVNTVTANGIIFR